MDFNSHLTLQLMLFICARSYYNRVFTKVCSPRIVSLMYTQTLHCLILLPAIKYNQLKMEGLLDTIFFMVPKRLNWEEFYVSKDQYNIMSCYTITGIISIVCMIFD